MIKKKLSKLFKSPITFLCCYFVYILITLIVAINFQHFTQDFYGNIPSSITPDIPISNMITSNIPDPIPPNLPDLPYVSSKPSYIPLTWGELIQTEEPYMPSLDYGTPHILYPPTGESWFGYIESDYNPDIRPQFKVEPYDEFLDTIVVEVTYINDLPFEEPSIEIHIEEEEEEQDIKE